LSVGVRDTETMTWIVCPAFTVEAPVPVAPVAGAPVPVGAVAVAAVTV
jgi:hypothetical protein